MGQQAQWQLVSHLTLNHLSITDSDQSLDALKQMLRLYNFSDTKTDGRRAALNRQMIEGMVNVRSQRVTRRVGTNADSAFCRGVQIELTLNEDNYVGIGGFLFASVMRHFFTKYASINSFAELKVVTQQRDQPMCHWPPIVGQEKVA